MKKFEVVIRGEHEAEIGHEILSGIYAAIQNYGYTDVSVQADTNEEPQGASDTGVSETTAEGHHGA